MVNPCPRKSVNNSIGSPLYLIVLLSLYAWLVSRLSLSKNMRWKILGSIRDDRLSRQISTPYCSLFLWFPWSNHSEISQQVCLLTRLISSSSSTYNRYSKGLLKQRPPVNKRNYLRSSIRKLVKLLCINWAIVSFIYSRKVLRTLYFLPPYMHFCFGGGHVGQQWPIGASIMSFDLHFRRGQVFFVQNIVPCCKNHWHGYYSEADTF